VRDSARYGATAVRIVRDEIFMLFGGRPRRQEHPAEPTVLIDVYGLDGRYRRSYLLPCDAEGMTTRDGETFYVLTERDDGVPLILVLRPRLARGRMRRTGPHPQLGAVLRARRAVRRSSPPRLG